MEHLPVEEVSLFLAHLSVASPARARRELVSGRGQCHLYLQRDECRGYRISRESLMLLYHELFCVSKAACVAMLLALPPCCMHSFVDCS